MLRELLPECFVNMDNVTRPSLSQEWKKGFHDDVDAESERSDAGLISDGLSKRWDTGKMRRPGARLAFEVLLLIVVAALSAFLAVDHWRHMPVLKRFGPTCEFTWRVAAFCLTHVANWLSATVPEKRVMFGNVAGFGPDLVYADNEMLRNATRLREVHENWQALFPSECIVSPSSSSAKEGRIPQAKKKLLTNLQRGGAML